MPFLSYLWRILNRRSVLLTNVICILGKLFLTARIDQNLDWDRLCKIDEQWRIFPIKDPKKDVAVRPKFTYSHHALLSSIWFYGKVNWLSKSNIKSNCFLPSGQTSNIWSRIKHKKGQKEKKSFLPL